MSGWCAVISATVNAVNQFVIGWQEISMLDTSNLGQDQVLLLTYMQVVTYVNGAIRSVAARSFKIIASDKAGCKDKLTYSVRKFFNVAKKGVGGRVRLIEGSAMWIRRGSRPSLPVE